MKLALVSSAVIALASSEIQSAPLPQFGYGGYGGYGVGYPYYGGGYGGFYGGGMSDMLNYGAVGVGLGGYYNHGGLGWLGWANKDGNTDASPENNASAEKNNSNSNDNASAPATTAAPSQ